MNIVRVLYLFYWTAAKIDGCPSPYPLIEETNKMAEQTISREQPTDQVVTIETPAHQLHQNMAIGERRSRKRSK